MVQTYINTHWWLTPQQWEGAVLQLHDDSIQHWQHGRDVQQDQDDWLKNKKNNKGITWKINQTDHISFPGFVQITFKVSCAHVEEHVKVKFKSDPLAYRGW